MEQGLLFSDHFLRDGIKSMPMYKSLATDGAAFSAAIDAMRAAYAAFPIARSPEETQTEDDLIYPVLDALGWSRDRWLAQPRATRKGRSDVPDMLLFSSSDDKTRANTERNKGDRYRHGIAVVENKRWQRPLDRNPTGRSRRTDEDSEVPSTQMLRYLSRAEALSDRRIQWGVLTNGRHWRLYYQGAKSRAEEYLEIDLPVLLGIEGVAPDLFAPKPEERAHWLFVFVLMFGRQSFVAAADSGRTFHQVALDEGRLWEERVADDLSRIVFTRLLPALADALDSTHPVPIRPRTTEYLAEIKHAAFILLYRLLFILYAEDRGLLPVRDRRYDDYALSRIRDDIARRIDDSDAFSSRSTRYYRHLQDLCRIIDQGDPELGMPSYNGGLFEAAAAPFLERVRLTDAEFAPIVDDLSRHDDGERKRRINYRDLSVQQLGSVYERLLEYELAEDGDDIRVEGDRAGRKGSGSYYTPEELVRLIIDRTVGPLLAEHDIAFEARARQLASDRRPRAGRLRELEALDPASRFLEIKVCDPAMGSGHFLVSLVDYLADRVLEAIAAAPAVVHFAEAGRPYESPLVQRIEQVRRRILDLAQNRKWNVEESQLDDRRIVRRMILKRVIHGVDKNPMAVELAKVALWLHTFTVGAPLSFLDHHLQCGDSLLGAWVRPAADWLQSRGSLLINRYIAPAERSAATMAEIETITDADIAEVEDSKAKYEAVAEATAPLAAFLSLVQAERLIGVFDVAPAKRPRDLADLMRSKASAAEIDRARRQWALYEPALAFQSVLDGSYGDPVQIATGKVPVAPTDMVEQLALLSDDPPEQPVLFSEPVIDQRRRVRAHELVNKARQIATDQRFLHWEVAFPNVWRNWMSTVPNGGFHAVIGNPPYVRQEQLGPIKPALKHAYAAYDGVADLYVYFYELGLRLLRPGGRLSYVVTNKWMKAGYAERLRGLFADQAWMELVADFGHAKQFFPDADVFPCVIVARKPDGSAPPSEIEACIIPREEVRPADLIGQVQRESYSVPRAAFTKAAWVIEPPAVLALFRKIKTTGVPLAAFASAKPYRGVLTGFNEAFLIDSATRDALTAADPKCAEIIKPYLRGQDVERWYSGWNGLWMIFARRGIDIDAYPSILQHLARFRGQLEPRPEGWKPGSKDDQWPGRKPGSYIWYEIQDAIAYHAVLESPKIIYNDITWNPQFSIDTRGMYVNNTAYMLPTADTWIAAVLNAPIGWWFAWRAAQHAKDEALRYFNTFVETYPIPRMDDATHQRVESIVDRLVAIHRDRHEAESALRDWYRHAHQIEKPSTKLREPFALDADTFVAAIKKALGRRASLSAAAIQSIKAEHARTVAPARALLAEADGLERKISDLVNETYGLTPDEVQLMWDTAPPRMPLSPPEAASAHA